MKLANSHYVNIPPN